MTSIVSFSNTLTSSTGLNIVLRLTEAEKDLFPNEYVTGEVSVMNIFVDTGDDNWSADIVSPLGFVDKYGDGSEWWVGYVEGKNSWENLFNIVLSSPGTDVFINTYQLSFSTSSYIYIPTKFWTNTLNSTQVNV